MIRYALFCLLLLTAPVPAFCWPGTVLSVHDGDTLTVAPGGDASTPIGVRLYGVDAPELAQPHGTDSRDWLAERLPEGTNVEIIPMDVDRYGRTVGLVQIVGRTVNAELVAEGQAWVYDRYCKAKFCASWKKAQKKARHEQTGLWSNVEGVPPWEWRQRERAR